MTEAERDNIPKDANTKGLRIRLVRPSEDVVQHRKRKQRKKARRS